MNTKRMIAVVAVLAMALAALAFVPAEENSAADEKEIVYFEGGELSSVLTGTSTQKVIIQKDLVIKKGGQILIEGDLEIPAGVTVTIEDGTAVQGKGIFTIIGNAVIDGTITSKVADGLYIKPGSGDATCDHTVTVNGIINAFGNATGSSVKAATLQASLADYGWPILESQSIIVNGSINVGSNAEAEFKQVIFSKDAALNVFGTVSDGSYIITSGTVNFDGVVGGTLNVRIANVSATVNIVNVTGKIGITDKGMYAYTYGGVQYFIGAVPAYINPQSGSATVAKIAKGSFYNDIEFENLTNVKVIEKVTTEIEDGEMSAKTEMRIAPLDSSNVVGAVSNNANIGVNNTLTDDRIGDTVFFDTMVVDGVGFLIKGVATASGEITYLETTNAFKLWGEAAKLKVEGLILMKNDQKINNDGGKLIAATYTIKDDKNRVDTYYTSLSKAIAADAKDITMLGQLIVEEDLTIPAGVKLTTDTAFDTSPGLKHEQCPVFVKEDATFTIADGAQFSTKGDLDIEGTFVIENIDYGITLKGIWADVQMKDGSRVMYTNIYNAFAKAEAGAELSAYNPVKGKIVIDEDLTIPAGMSFSNEGIAYSTFDKMKTIVVNNGATFTIAGTLYINATDNLISEENGNGWNEKTPATDLQNNVVKDYSVIKVGDNGVLAFDNSTQGLTEKTVFLKYIIFGAYYQNDTNDTADAKLYITSIPYAFADILNSKNNTVNIYGDAEINNMKVSGTEKERIIVNFCLTEDYTPKITMNGFTFGYGKVYVEGAKLNGDIGTSTGRMFFEDAKIRTVAFEEQFIDDALNFTILKTIKSTGIGSTHISISGTVYIDGVQFKQSQSPQDGTCSDDKFVVPSGSKLKIINNNVVFQTELLIEGELDVCRDAKLISPRVISVLGTLDIEKTDGHSGSLSATCLLIGGSNDSFDSAKYLGIKGNATVRGAGTMDLSSTSVFVFNGASVTADVLKDWMDNTAKSTEFYVDGALWMTGYVQDPQTKADPFATGSTDPDTSEVVTSYNYKPAIANCDFNAWQTYDEKNMTYSDIVLGDGVSVCIGQPGYEKVYASIDRSIYDVTIVADMGIDDIFIDGKIILKDKTSNTFTEKVSAGTHTITYTLANGYSGNASITAIDGKTITGSGLTFVIDDDKAGTDMKMEITVSGIEKSGYDTDPETHDEKASGLTTTEILLIVVVVIIAIMAVVLILRLNRS